MNVFLKLQKLYGHPFKVFPEIVFIKLIYLSVMMEKLHTYLTKTISQNRKNVISEKREVCAVRTSGTKRKLLP